MELRRCTPRGNHRRGTFWQMIVGGKRAHAFLFMRIMRPSARCFIFPVPLIRLAAARELDGRRSYKSSRKREISTLASLCSLHLGKRLASKTTKERAYARLTLETTRARSLHYVNSPPLASSASSRARFIRARVVSPPILRAISDNDAQRRFRAKYQRNRSSENWSDILGQK